MVIIDSSIIIDHLRQAKGLDTILYNLVNKLHDKENLAISVLTVQELYTGRSSRNEAGESKMLATISNLDILAYEYKEAKLAGELGRDSIINPGFIDLAIAATAIIQNAKVATLNKKHFAAIKNVKLIDLENL